LRENIKGFDTAKRLSKEDEEKIEEILGNRPEAKMNWKNWQPFNPRR